MTLQMQPAQLRQLRLYSQRITPAASEQLTVDSAAGPGNMAATAATVSAVAATARQLLALQGQDFGQALWGLGVRTGSSTRGQVLAALENGSVVRSAPIRGTMHFLAGQDLRWMLALTSTRTLASARTRFSELGLDQSTFDRTEQVAAAALAGGGQLTRAEFFTVLRAAGISTEGQRGYHIIFYLSQRAIVCWGPPRATQQALVLVDEWIPPAPVLDRSAALREFALRYFTGHGPATVRDFAWWSKLTLADARAALASARDELVEIVHEGESYWASSGEVAAFVSSEVDVAEERIGAHRVVRFHALPGFDEYLLGYQDRSLVMEPHDFGLVVPGKNGIFRPVLVADGTVVGTWRRETGRSGGVESPPAKITAEPFHPLTEEDTTALAAVNSAYAQFWKR